MRLFIRRIIGATILDVATYEEVEADTGATLQALLVVLLSALAAGIGARGFGYSQIPTLALIGVVALLGWAIWALLTFEIGGRLFPEPQTEVDVGQLLRTIGFASAPGILRVFGALPEVAAPVFALTAVWMLVAMIVAVRQALDYTSTTRAVAVCGLGWAVTLAMILVLGLLISPPVS